MPTLCATRSVTRFSDRLQRDAQRRRAAELHLEVVRPPAARRAHVHHDRRVQEALAGRDALLQRRQIDERLEAGARLALRLGGAVELAALETPATDQREHPSGPGIERDQRALDSRNLPQCHALLCDLRRFALRVWRRVSGSSAIARPAQRRPVRPSPRRPGCMRRPSCAEAPAPACRPSPAAPRRDRTAAACRCAAAASDLRLPGRVEPAETLASVSVMSPAPTASFQSGSMPCGLRRPAPAARPSSSPAPARHRDAGPDPRQPPSLRSQRHQPVAHRLLGHGLQRGIEAGAHHQPALRRHIGAELRDQLRGAPPRRTSPRRESAAAGGTPTAMIGSALAAAACAAEMTWSSAIRSSTQSRRALAASGKRNGL